jgi:hypothetical protein
MLLPPSIPAVPASSSVPRESREMNDESLTDDYGEASSSRRTMSGGVDFFSSLGTEHKKKQPEKPDPEKVFLIKRFRGVIILIYRYQPKLSSRELNPDIISGKAMNLDEPLQQPKANVPGGPGSSWRMMRLRKVYETAEEDNRPLEEVAIERFGSLASFEEAKEERRILDDRAGRKADRDRERGRTNDRRTEIGSGGEKKLMFTDIGGSGASSRSSSFRRPGAIGESTPSTPSPPTGAAPVNRRLDSLRLPSQASSPLAKSHTPIPSVMTPPPPVASGSSSSGRALSPSSLNRLQAKVLRAKLMGAPDAEKLEREYDMEAQKAHGGQDDGGGSVRTKVEVLPTLDARGRLYDVGHGGEDDKRPAGNRRKKEEKVNFLWSDKSCSQY